MSLNMTYLAGEEMAADFHKDLVVLVGGLVPWNNDLSAGQVLQLVHLEKTQRSQPLTQDFNASRSPTASSDNVGAVNHCIYTALF